MAKASVFLISLCFVITNNLISTIVVHASTHLDRSPVASFSEPIVSPKDGDNTTIPFFYGWFFNESIAESMSIIGKKYFIECYDTIPQFQVFMNNLMQQNNVSNPLEYYKKPLDPNTQLPDLHYHTTAKFCGRNDSISECSSYLQQVGQYLGRPYKMHLVGLFFTPKTYGIRVKLTPDEQKLFRGDARENSAQAMVDTDTDDDETNEVTINLHGRSSSNNNGNNHNGEGFSYEPYYYSNNNRNQSGDVTHRHPFYPGIRFRPQRDNFHPTESRAHVTLGCAPNVETLQTALDLLEEIDMEVSTYALHKDYAIGGAGEEIPKATLRQYKIYDDLSLLSSTLRKK